MLCRRICAGYWWHNQVPINCWLVLIVLSQSLILGSAKALVYLEERKHEIKLPFRFEFVDLLDFGFEQGLDEVVFQNGFWSLKNKEFPEGLLIFSLRAVLRKIHFFAIFQLILVGLDLIMNTLAELNVRQLKIHVQFWCHFFLISYVILQFFARFFLIERLKRLHKHVQVNRIVWSTFCVLLNLLFIHVLPHAVSQNMLKDEFVLLNVWGLAFCTTWW